MRRPVFVSFASEDIDLANRVLDRLEGAGIRCWIAHRDIAPGTSYPAAISAALASSGAVLLLLTDFSNRSPHVLRETEMAFNARTPILPVKMAGIEPSADLLYFLSMTQWVDAGSTFDKDDGARTQEALQKLLDRQPVPDDTRHDSHRRRMIVMAAAMAVVAALVAALLWTLGGGDRTPDAATISDRSAATDARLPPPPVEVAAPPPAASPIATPPAAPADRIRTKENPGDGQMYVWIRPGRYVMGCSSGDTACDEDEKPAHGVAIAKGFWLARTEVTSAQYAKRAGAGRQGGAAGGNLPKAEVTWTEAKAHCAAVGGRLPTEAEWEYAARAGTTTRYYDTPAMVAWYAGNSEEHPHPVGLKAPNAFGLYDMLGNVAEWVRDRYFNAYDDSGEDEAIVEPLASNASAVARGGSWYSDAGGIRASRRLNWPPDGAEPIIGFRCAHDAL